MVLVQVVVVFIIDLGVPLVLLVHRGLVGLAPGIRRETYGAVRQALGAANYGVDSEGVESISQRLRNC